MLVMLHGWSDRYRSFERLGRELHRRGIAPRLQHIRLGDYISLDDDIRFTDLSAALDAAWRRHDLPRQARSVNVLVHSTGSLIIRHWMTRYFQANANPVHRLLMLAPANFGSPLAHKGRAFLGRVVKGFKSRKPFQTGARILRGLELASPFSWQLAEVDRFSDQRWYGPGRVLATTLVGNSGYNGISAIANEAGGDGTVLVSSANLNVTKAVWDFHSDPQNPGWTLQQPQGRTAFSRLNRENHASIVLKERGPREKTLYWDLLERALSINDANFDSWCDELDQLSESQRTAAAGKAFQHGLQNTVLRLRDDHGHQVPDYVLELFAKKKQTTGQRTEEDRSLTRRLQDRAIVKVHAYQADASYRSLRIDCQSLSDVLANAAPPRDLHLSITATPQLGRSNEVGYKTLAYEDIGSIRLDQQQAKSMFAPDRTLLIDAAIRREVNPKVFDFKDLG